MIHLFWMSQNKISWSIVLSLRMLDFYFLITCFFIDLYFLILISNSIVFIVDAIGKPLLVFLCLCWMLLSAIKLQWPRHELLGSTLLTSFKWWFSPLSGSHLCICCSSSLSGTAVTLAFCYNQELPQSRELSNCRTDFFCYFPTSIFPPYLPSFTIINPIAFSQNSRVNLPLTALNHDAHLSSLLIDVPQGIFSPQNKAHLFASGKETHLQMPEI